MRNSTSTLITAVCIIILLTTGSFSFAQHSSQFHENPLPLPLKTGQVFVVDDFNTKVTKTDLGFNYFAGNTGATESSEEIVTLGLSSESHGEPGGSLQISFDFDSHPQESFAGYFASVLGLTDTLVSLDGSGEEPPASTPFPDYFLNIHDLFRTSTAFPDLSIEQLQFQVRLESSEPITLKLELKDENDFDVFTRCTLTEPYWQTMTFSLPTDFDDSVKGYGDASDFNWEQVSVFSVIIERVNIGAGIQNPDTGSFLLDNLVFIDTDGSYPDLSSPQLVDPETGSLDLQYGDAFLEYVCKTSMQYFLDFASTDLRTGGIIQDRSSFAELMTAGGVGFQLTAYVIGAERGYVSRENATSMVRDILEKFYHQPHGPERVGTIGYQGFFYHFLGIDGLRKQNFDFEATPDLDESLNTVELSTIDTALAIAGVVTAGQYFCRNDPTENAIRNLAHTIYSRVNWPFMLDDERFSGSNQFFLGWKPNENRDDDSGAFGRFKLDDDPITPLGQYSSKNVDGTEVPATLDYYTDEGLLIALLSMASPNPDHRLPRDVWDAMIRNTGGGSFVKTYPGSLFTYTFFGVWLDTQALEQDNHPHPVDFFENTVNAIQATRDYCTANPNNRATWQDSMGSARWGLSATEGPLDKYFAHTSPSAALAQDGGIILESGTVSLESEDGTGDGTFKTRSTASNQWTVWLHAGETRSVDFSVTADCDGEVVVRYSNDNDGPLEHVDVFIDSSTIGSFDAQDTGDYGYGWNVFVESPALGPVALSRGDHTLSVSVSGGDGYGVEIDVFTLTLDPVIRPLEDGTVTAYGAGCSVVYEPEIALASLWDLAQLGLLHPRFGFADSFNLDIADAIQINGNYLREEGFWANFTGFAIDHGPMLAIIDNYLYDQTIPTLFMSHPLLHQALVTLFPNRQRPGDRDDDRDIDGSDLALMANDYGRNDCSGGNCTGDVDDDGDVDEDDLSALARDFGKVYYLD